MGRLRNLSQSFKAAAFASSNGHGSPSNNNNRRSGSPDDATVTKDVPALTREVSSTSIPEHQTIRLGRSRPTSQVYNSRTIIGSKDDPEELRPVFSYLSSHQNKLYQEGYFLKLSDLDTNGKPNTDRNWTECFAQLVGTILSLWDAAALDAAGNDGEVAPTFINLADASIKMIETLPTRNPSVKPLQNVLSVSTAGKNRYLLHFNSLHSLTQWTAGIRLAMFEHASLQELYTGSLIAGKGKYLNNIKQIMDKLRFVEEDWARVRFGAGTPWRRCWYVIEPADEKEWQKTQKLMKKRGMYERPEYPRGVIKFYDSKKTKKTTPVATISDVYSAYAIYPQSKPLIDQSTLVKLEGKITIHSQPESVTEGFVYVMPELHAAVSGFEMLLRFLFPAFDTFVLYGRPNRLIADTLDTRGLMFAMPKDRRYGYLDIIDVAGLIHTEGSEQWSESEWRKRMKDLVSRRMTMATQGRTSNVEHAGRRSMGARPGIRYEDSATIGSNALPTPNESTDMLFDQPKPYMAPAAASSVPAHLSHSRSISESVTTLPNSRQRKYPPSRLSSDQNGPEAAGSFHHRTTIAEERHHQQYKNGIVSEDEIMTSSNSSSSELGPRVDTELVTHDLLVPSNPPAPVNQPVFQHQPSDRPQRRPADRPELRREKSRMSNATLDQLVDASKKGSDAGAAATAAWRSNGNRRYDSQEFGVRVIGDHPTEPGTDANPFLKAISTDLPTEPSIRGYPEHFLQLPHLQTTTYHSVTRKPLPVRARPLVSTDNLSSSMYTRGPLPGYASTTPSEEAQSATRKSGGVRKTIGDPNHDRAKSEFDIPEFSFGITQSLTPGHSRPGTAAGRVSPLEHKSPSAPHTPNEDRRSRVDRVSPAQLSPLPSPQSRPSSRQLWHPGLATGRQSPGGLNAEEFVQQRAAMARLPGGYVTRRTVSSSRAEDMMVPMQEQSPGKKPQKKTIVRPTFRGSALDFSSSLSAREQEHVARMTGTPLLNLDHRTRTPDPDVGLIGAISAREQDRRSMKEGISSQLAQATIAQRQQQAQAAYMYQIQAQYRPGMNAWQQQQQQQQHYQQFQQPHASSDYFPTQQRPSYIIEHQSLPQDPYAYTQYHQSDHQHHHGFYGPGGNYQQP